MSEDRSALIEEERVRWRDTSGKMRSALDNALRKGTKDALKEGCLKALRLLDFSYPVGMEFHAGNEMPASVGLEEGG